jgi:hypothetical protein
LNDVNSYNTIKGFVNYSLLGSKKYPPQHRVDSFSRLGKTGLLGRYHRDFSPNYFEDKLCSVK